jgi:hypothetical protein
LDWWCRNKNGATKKARRELYLGIKKGGLRMKKLSYVSIHVRLLKEQYEWLRKYSYENRVPQAEVIRKLLEMYSQEKCK